MLKLMYIMTLVAMFLFRSQKQKIGVLFLRTGIFYFQNVEHKNRNMYHISDSRLLRS